MAHTEQPACHCAISGSVSGGIRLLFQRPRHLPGTSFPWDFDARSTPDSKKLTLRDFAVVLWYGQISSHPPMASKGFPQIQIATEIGQSESHVCSGWSNTTHITKIAPFLLKCGGYGSPNRPHGPQITPGHIPNNTWSTHKHTWPHLASEGALQATLLYLKCIGPQAAGPYETGELSTSFVCASVSFVSQKTRSSGIES